MSYGFGRLNELAERVHENAMDKGFWDHNPAGDVTGLLSLGALIHTEVSCLQQYLGERRVPRDARPSHCL